MKAKQLWLIYFGSNFLFSLLAIFVLSNLVKLGDSERYISAGVFFSFAAIYDSSIMMDMLGGFFGVFLGKFTALLFSLAHSYVTYYALRDLFLKVSHLFVCLLLLSFPSYMLWTNIVSKEVIVSSVMLIVASQIVRAYFGLPMLSKTVVFLALYLLVVFKPHFIPAVFLCYIVYVCYCKSNFGALSFVLLNVLGWGGIFILLYLSSDILDDVVFRMVRAFDLTAGASREPFWNSPGDWYAKALEGMYLSFIGPSFQEASQSPFVLFVFVESMLLVFLILLFYSHYVSYALWTSRIQLSAFAVILYSFIIILFCTYPFGVINYGSAVRYRQGYYPFLVVVFYCFYIYRYRRKYKII